MPKILKSFLFLLLVVAILITGNYFLLKNKEFSKAEWINKPNERVEIVQDLINSYELVGMTKSEIVHLLGEPENAYFKEPDNLSYYLGVEDGFMSVDGSTLVIWFNNDIRVTRYEIKYD